MRYEHRTSEVFIVMAAIIVILAGVKAAAGIVEPFLLSIFIAIIFSPFFGWLNNKGLPSAFSLFLVIIFIIGIIGLMGILIGSSVNDFSSNLAYYEERLHEQAQSALIVLNSYGIEVPKEEIAAIFDTNRLLKVVSGGLKSLGGMLANGFVIILTVAFMLLESIHLTQKINEADSKKNTLAQLNAIINKIKKYMLIKTYISIFTGVLVWIVLVLFQIDYAVLWAIFAFFLNYIPNIGSLIAAVPPVLLGVVQFGFIPAIEIAIAYIIINIVVGSIIEPKVMGSGLGLSTLIVFLSLIFWGWLLGPVGMLLSIPLTIMAKIIFDSKADTRWIAIMLGTGEKLK
ncbi:MAG: AI-2E family transporter [Campylobacterota bacterium]|nr:AI-2E family transporter [Campylobacterota bacterium]